MIRLFSILTLAFGGLLHGQSLSISPGEQVVPVTGKLMRLEFETVGAKHYRIESSPDLSTWKNEGYAFRGIDGRMSALVSNHDLPKLFYRVRDDAAAGEVAPLSPYGQVAAIPVAVAGPEGPAGPAGPQGVPGQNLAAANVRVMESPPQLPRTLQRIIASRQAGAAPPFRLSYLMLGDSYALDLSYEAASFNTHRVSGLTSPVRSASGTKSSGFMSSCCGCCQRTRASTSVMWPVFTSTLG